jgi:peptidoglycan/xylan/chitin deacetylase (PgdA/CDA1 family)
MLEQWSDGAAPGLGPMGNPLKPAVIDTQARSWAEYGPRCGAWRLLDVLDDLGVEAVFYVSGILAERYPKLMSAIDTNNHSIAAHGWAQDILPVYQTPEEELSDLKRSVAAIERAVGLSPRGFLSPRCTPSMATASLLAAEGFAWHSDYFDADLPRLQDFPRGQLVAMPFTMEVNDLPLAVRYGNEPSAFTAILRNALDEGRRMASRPACMDITVHAHVFGRAASIGVLREAIRVVREYESSAWLTTHAKLADLFGNAPVKER